jgi:DNA-binding response OmpR family regulator
MVKRVLFINHVSPASVIPELLVGAGYEVYEAFDSDAGLNRQLFQSYDLVILLDSAAAESWVLCGKIRRLTTSPFIVIGSGASAETCVKAINSGADFFIRKPFGPLELLARINALLQRVPALQPVPLVS